MGESLWPLATGRQCDDQVTKGGGEPVWHNVGQAEERHHYFLATRVLLQDNKELKKTQDKGLYFFTQHDK